MKERAKSAIKKLETAHLLIIRLEKYFITTAAKTWPPPLEVRTPHRGTAQHLRIICYQDSDHVTLSIGIQSHTCIVTQQPRVEKKIFLNIWTAKEKPMYDAKEFWEEELAVIPSQ